MTEYRSKLERNHLRRVENRISERACKIICRPGSEIRDLPAGSFLFGMRPRITANMKTSLSLSRRHFLQTSMIGSAAIAAAKFCPSAVADVTKPVRDPFDGLKVGITSYTLRQFKLDEAIAMTKQAG